jgi:hypothetical protein
MIVGFTVASRLQSKITIIVRAGGLAGDLGAIVAEALRPRSGPK